MYSEQPGRLTRRDLMRYMGLGAGMLLVAACSQPAATPTPAPAAGAAAPSGTKSNGTKLTAWGWQSFTPEGDKALGDQIKEWGSANKTDVEYVVVENSQ